METKEIKITPPAGYEIDKENSTFDCIKFKPKSLTYDDVAKSLFENNPGFYTEFDGNISDTERFYGSYAEPNNGASKKQLEKLLAINKLMNVAKYLNDSWQPDWNDISEHKHFISIEDNKIKTAESIDINRGCVYFKTKELAQQAIDILGEDTIRLALSTDW